MARRAKTVFISNLTGMLILHRRMARKALQAAALVVVNKAKNNVRGGFKSGAFVTGRLASDIQHGRVRGIKTPKIRVGSKIWTDADGRFAPYPAYWEVGHQNVVTGSFEQEKWLSNAMKSTAQEQQDMAVGAIQNEVEGSEFFFPGFKLNRSSGVPSLSRTTFNL